MIERTRTDVEISLDSPEFIWDISTDPESHGYLSAPILALLKRHGIRTALDLGCGNGSLTEAIARAGIDVTGMDISQSGIALARKTYPDRRFEQHDLGHPLPKEHQSRYQAVVSTEVIEHMLFPRRLVDNALSALEPGGMFILSTPYHGYLKNLLLALTNKFDDHWHPLRDLGHIKFFSRSTILALLAERGFVRLRFSTAGRIPALAKSMIASGYKPP